MHSLLDNSKLPNKKGWLLLLLGVALTAIFLLASGLSKMELLPGCSIPLAGILQALNQTQLTLSGVSLPFNMIRPIIACIWILLIASVIGFIVSSEIRKEVFKRAIIYSLWLILFYYLITALQPYLSQFTASTPAGPPGDTLLDAADTTQSLPTPPNFVVDPPQWIVWGVSILLIFCVVAVVWLIWYFLSARKKETPLEIITQEAQQALDNIQAGHDLRDTIKRCYFEMSQTLSQQRNLHRRSGMTPREFEQFLAESGLRTEHIKRLTRLFENVRYGNKSYGHREELEAVDCLTAIVNTYGQPSL